MKKKTVDLTAMTRSVIPDSDPSTWVSSFVQKCKDQIDFKIKFYEKAFGSRSGLEATLAKQAGLLDSKNGDTNSLNYSSDTLLAQLGDASKKLAELKTTLNSAAREELKGLETSFNSLEKTTSKPLMERVNDQLGGIKVKLDKLCVAHRAVYQTRFQADKRVMLQLKAGLHLEGYAKLLAETLKQLATSDTFAEEMRELIAQQNVNDADWDLSGVALWTGLDHGCFIIKKLAHALSENKGPISAKIDEAAAGLEETPAWQGVTGQITTVDVLKTIFADSRFHQLHDNPGSRPWTSSMRDKGRRTGGTAHPLPGCPMVYMAHSEPIVFQWCLIQDILDTGGITLGPSFEKFFDDPDDGAAFYKSKVRTLVLEPGQFLYLPFGCWPMPLAYDTKATSLQKTLICWPIPVQRNMLSVDFPLNVVSALKVHYDSVWKKKNRDMWDEIRKFSDIILDTP